MTHDNYSKVERHLLYKVAYPALYKSNLIDAVEKGEAEELLKLIPEIHIALLGLEVDLLKAVAKQKETTIAAVGEVV